MTVLINGEPFRLSFNLAALEDIEETFGGLAEMRDAMNGNGKKGKMWSVVEIMRIYINAARMEDADEFHTQYKPISHQFIATHMRIDELMGITETLLGVAAEGMHAKMRDPENDDDVRDLSTEAVKKETRE